MYQQLLLVGRLGDDPELRYTADNVPVCSFRLAVNKQWTSAEGEPAQQTTWFRVTTWRRQAEVAAGYLRQGRQVLVIGEIKPPHIYLDRKGEPAATLDVTAHTLKFLGADGGHPDDLETDPVQGSLLADIPL